MSYSEEEDFEKAEHEWAPLIGRFILNYGYLESEIDDVLRIYQRDSVVNAEELTKDFKEKLKVFEKILCSQGLGPELADEFCTAVCGISILWNTRCLLAHNPLVLSLEENQSGEYDLVGFEIFNHVKKRSITFSELQEELRDLLNCCETVKKVMIQYGSTKFMQMWQP
jgi:hypothetical protein